MKKIILGLLLCAGVCLAGFAETAVPAKEYSWPKSPERFRIVSVIIDLEWKDGRPFANRSDLAKLIHIPAEGSESVDLIEALDEKGWYVRKDHNGDIQAINPHGVSSGNAVDPKTREKNLTAAKYKPSPTPGASKTPQPGVKPDSSAAGIDPNTGLPYGTPNNNPNAPKH